LKYAVRHDLIIANPMEKVERSKAQQFTGAFYSVEEVEQLFEAAKGNPTEFPILMTAFYGLRRSEIMGLRWQAVGFASNTIRIEHTVVQFRSGGEQRIGSKDQMKNKSSCRTMPLVPQFRRLLLQMQERQKNCRELCGNCCTDTDYIYVNDLGVPYKPNYILAFQDSASEQQSPGHSVSRPSSPFRVHHAPQRRGQADRGGVGWPWRHRVSGADILPSTTPIEASGGGEVHADNV